MNTHRRFFLVAGLISLVVLGWIGFEIGMRRPAAENSTAAAKPAAVEESIANPNAVGTDPTLSDEPVETERSSPQADIATSEEAASNQNPGAIDNPVPASAAESETAPVAEVATEAKLERIVFTQMRSVAPP